MGPSEGGEVYAVVIQAPFQALFFVPHRSARNRLLYDVVNHYDGFFKLALTEQEKNDLVQHLLGL